ncbi:MAG: signal peptidase II [Spirochaetaceae bacterium]|nr:signal peptidase II [Spirochaetaceae bacterium]
MNNDISVEKNTNKWVKIIPLFLTVAILVVDQITKWLITKNIAPYSVGASFGGDFLRIIHVYNPGAAFSMGHGLSDIPRMLVLGVIPLIVLVLVLVVYFKSNDFTKFQRWAIAGIVGGGLGNLVDRFFRPEGVVDFIDVKFYGIFGLERWPTFNVADSAICVCSALLIISLIKAMIQDKKLSKEQENNHDA